ncbi:hypothetical protein MUK42_33963 [Musa troglodytarum]|uniref:Uncharacterized protein n=1 Tax=Musa troglodytarum TaxID=320322 RepID=A0A9E7FXI3_9LILI|nr:hypothetical protein MUK42_33963 [Musa troglodytarum]
MKHLAQTRRNPRNRGRQQQQKPQGGAAGDLLSPEMDVAYICGGAGWAQCGSAIVFSPDLILAALQPRQKRSEICSCVQKTARKL